MSETFKNTQVDIEKIPHLGMVSFQPLEKDFLKVMLITITIFWVVIALAVIIVIGLQLDYPSNFNFIGLGILSLFLVFSYWLVITGFHKRSYALRQKDILYKKGIFWKSITTVPFNRVQHCEVKQGPIDRMFNLSQLNIYTAGGSQSDLTIPGLQPSKAQDLKNYIIKKTGQDESE